MLSVKIFLADSLPYRLPFQSSSTPQLIFPITFSGPKMASHRWSWLVKLSFRVATFAYYRFFELNTLGPLRHLSELTVDPDDFPKLVPFLTRWRERKIAELQYLSIAVFDHVVSFCFRRFLLLTHDQATVFMGSSIGLLGLSLSRSAHWLASAAFYCTILISIFGFCISAEQISILSFLGPVGKGGINCEWTTRSIRRYLAVMLSEVRPEPCKTEAQVTGLGVGVWKLKWKAVFMWQCPFMFLTYDVGLFVFGLTVNICTPLLNGDKWSEAWLVSLRG